MVKSLFIFGNGLGRAISNEFFSLPRVLNEAWNAEGVLSDKQKKLIQSCLPDDVIDNGDGAPTGEDELSDLHRVLSACDTIRSFEDRIADENGNWLTEEGLEFPSAIRRYLHNAACRFNHGCDGILAEADRTLPAEFQSSLRSFVMNKGAHIATLNYDDLLYDCFTDTDVFTKRRLRDGFLKSRFDWETHLAYRNPANEGWFLHLHGSPLFITKRDGPTKIMRAEMADYIGHESAHLVLTNVSFKRAVIQSSLILRTYWAELSRQLDRCTNIVLFGYGGYDDHLNELIFRMKPEKKIRIVEYPSGETCEQRMDWWWARVGARDIDLHELENVLEFKDWADD